MTGSKSTEMTVVQGGQLGLVEPFGDRQDGSVHKSHICVSIPVAKLANTPVILGLDILDLLGAGSDIVEQGSKHSRMQADVHPIINFYQHGSRNHQRFIGLFDQVAAGNMISVAPIERGV